MVDNRVPHLKGQVQSLTVFFQLIHHTQTLFVVCKIRRVAPSQCFLAGMAKGGMSKVVSQCRRFRQILIQAQCARNGTCNLCHLKRVRQTGTVMIPHGGKEHLRFIHQSAECL